MRNEACTVLVLIYLWRNEPEKAASRAWFWPLDERVIEAARAYRN